MPRRTDLESILLIGSGPIVIGQACEFDYSGTQAVKALREEGYRVILVNSNPATIMTDPEVADRTYVEPLTVEALERVIVAEKPDALLPTLGGQTGLNLAVALSSQGILRKHGVEMIGADEAAIRRAEERLLFKETVEKIGLRCPKSRIARSLEEARAARDFVGIPAVLRPSFTLGGTGGGVAYNRDEFDLVADRALTASPTREVLVEESVEGWKEFELEVMRDRADNVVIICSIENVDPMGVHTGDSITVAPVQTLTDREYQRMRDAAIRIIRAVGVETGGSNIQFAVNPVNGEMVVIEMNPRVSRSSALASKATGFPIAKIAAKLAVGYTLPEIPNDITRKTPACFEPTIDYVVVKIPRFTFEKFPGADTTLTIQMKSVGEVMAIGRTFPEALQKGLRSLETGRAGLGCDRSDPWGTPRCPSREEVARRLAVPRPDRILDIRLALRWGMDLSEIARLTRWDPWFLHEIEEIVRAEDRLRGRRLADLRGEELREAKRMGFSDAQLAHLTGRPEPEVRAARLAAGVRPVFKMVDTCAAEFEAETPYYYSTYEDEDELRPPEKDRYVILGGGPNRIGQGIEFDYCCVHAVQAIRRAGAAAVMVNCNPETVSTDYDTSDVLFFEPLTVEDVLNVVDAVRPKGVIVQLGGQTPLNISRALEAAGVPIVGTSPEDIDRASDRRRFGEICRKLGILQPPGLTATDLPGARAAAAEVGYPVLVRPSYVLGGRAMEIVYDERDLDRYMESAVQASPEKPVLVDRFLEEAIEVDVDAVADGTSVVVGGVLEHIEHAGVHSGDASCVLPPFSLTAEVLDRIRGVASTLARELRVRGLVNVQLAVKDGEVYVLEVNPRASRTVPFVGKATGVPLARIGTEVMLGRTLAEAGFTREPAPAHVSVKKSVFPFIKFPGVDVILGPEMRSTGEVMGVDPDLGCAVAKAEMAASARFPLEGAVFLSVRDRDKPPAVFLARKLATLGFKIWATSGTHAVLRRNGIASEPVLKIAEGRPNVGDRLLSGEIHLVINTPSGRGPATDEAKIRTLAIGRGIPVITTMAGASAAVKGVEALRRRGLQVRALQDYYGTGPGAKP